MSFSHILVLALVQGIAELLPVSSSAHVIVAEKLLGLDPTTPQMTLLLVMLHTGTMLAVITYFWKTWRATYFSSAHALRANTLRLMLATVLTACVGLTVLQLIKHTVARNSPGFEIESLFGNAKLMAAGLTAAGVLILVSSRFRPAAPGDLTVASAAWIGAVQGLCLPLRGFSRSGSTISTALIAGVSRLRAEEFSFALAVLLTPPVLFREVHRMHTAAALSGASGTDGWWPLFGPGVLGMILSFLAGLLALRWLSSWLEAGRWHLFGIYCLVASAAVLWLG